jgi:hypothetical protein
VKNAPPNRVRKPPGPHRRNILTALARGSKKPGRSEAKELLRRASIIILSTKKAPPTGGAKFIAAGDAASRLGRGSQCARGSFPVPKQAAPNGAYADAWFVMLDQTRGHWGIARE